MSLFGDLFHITFKYLLNIISPIVGWFFIETFTNPCPSVYVLIETNNVEQRDLRIHLLYGILHGLAFLLFHFLVSWICYMACQLQLAFWHMGNVNIWLISIGWAAKSVAHELRTPRCTGRLLPKASVRRSSDRLLKGWVCSIDLRILVTFFVNAIAETGHSSFRNMRQHKNLWFCRSSIVKHRSNPCNLSISFACPNFETWSSNVQHVAVDLLNGIYNYHLYILILILSNYDYIYIYYIWEIL